MCCQKGDRQKTAKQKDHLEESQGDIPVKWTELEIENKNKNGHFTPISQ